MGLFGDIDATEVSDNPFYVAPDVYKCILTEANLVEKKDQTGFGISFKWVIEEEDSEFNGQNVSDWNNVYPGLTADDITPEIKAAMSRTKQRLVQMGLTDADMDVLLDDDNLDDLVGLEAFVTIVETQDKNDPDKKYSNIRKIELVSDEE